MQRKMELLEAAMGIICNAPSDGTSSKAGDEWREARDRWIARYQILLEDQRVKEHNKRIQIANAVAT